MDALAYLMNTVKMHKLYIFFIMVIWVWYKIYILYVWMYIYLYNLSMYIYLYNLSVYIYLLWPPSGSRSEFRSNYYKFFIHMYLFFLLSCISQIDVSIFLIIKVPIHLKKSLNLKDDTKSKSPIICILTVLCLTIIKQKMHIQFIGSIVLGLI